MKKMLTRLLSMLLCFVLLCGMLPVLPVSAAITEEDGYYEFETFDDLKQLVSQTYSEYATVFYVGTEDLVISEDLTIPEYMDLYLFDGGDITTIIPEGVTVTVSERGYLDAWHLVVNGTLDLQSNCWVNGDLTVNGDLSTSSLIYFYGDTVTGYENIRFTNENAQIYANSSFESVDEMVSFVNETVVTEERRFFFEINMTNQDRVRLTESFTIPSNCAVYLYGGSFLIAEGCTLTVDGQVYSYDDNSLIVNGALCNNGYMDFTGRNGRALRFNQGSAYSGDGLLFVNILNSDDISDLIQGVENFTSDAAYEGEGDTTYEVDLSDASIVGVSDGSVSRIAGQTRYATSFAIADAMKEALGVNQFTSIIVASGTNFADALAGSYLAAVKEAPILITDGRNSDDISDYVAENLADDGIVYILGGTASVPQQVEDALTSNEVAVERLAGASRFDTSVAILRAAGVTAEEEILVCTGYSFADSLSASASGLPILLVNNTTGELTESQYELLGSLGYGEFTIIGGTSSVSNELEGLLRNYGAVERIAGENRYLTSVAVAEHCFGSPSGAMLAYGRNFPDGLCGGPLAYVLNAPLILTEAGAEAEAAEYCADYMLGGCVLGGTASLPDSTVRTVFGLEDDAVIPLG